MIWRLSSNIWKKNNRPSFGYYKFISAGHLIRATNLLRSPSHSQCDGSLKRLVALIEWPAEMNL